MIPLFDRRSRERLERVGAALSESAPAWRRAPPPELRARILAAVDARSRPSHTSTRSRTAWVALAAGIVIAVLAWQAAVPPVRSLADPLAESLVRRAWTGLPAPSIARALDRPLVAEVGHMRADVTRAFDFLVARVSLPLATRAHSD